MQPDQQRIQGDGGALYCTLRFFIPGDTKQLGIQLNPVDLLRNVSEVEEHFLGMAHRGLGGNGVVRVRINHQSGDRAKTNNGEYKCDQQPHESAVAGKRVGGGPSQRVSEPEGLLQALKLRPF